MDVELPSITREEREDLQKEALEFERDALVADLEPTEYFSYLRSKRILDSNDCEEIRAEATRKRKSEKFLDVIACRGSSGFTEFCEALMKRRVQSHLVRRLNIRMSELETSFRRRKAVVLIQTKWEQESVASVRQERGISEEERKSIIEAMRHGSPVPSLTSTKVTTYEPEHYYTHPARSPSLVSVSSNSSAVECYHKHDPHPTVVMSRYSSSNSSSAGLAGTVTPDTYVLNSLKGLDDDDSPSAFPSVQPLS